MHQMKRILVILCLYAPALKAQVPPVSVQQTVWQLTEVMFHDVVNPPAAARFYAYSLLSGYEALSELNNTLPPFQKTFRNYTLRPFAQTTQRPDPSLTVLYCIL